jgi:hypothetical protein
MCMQVKCAKCGKPTWSGCGAHIEPTRAGVPKEKRCQCQKPPKAEKSKWLSWLGGRG